METRVFRDERRHILAVMVAEPIVRLKKKAKVRPETFEIVLKAIDIATGRHFLAIQGGGYRGAMYTYLEQLVLDGKASIRWNHKHTRYLAKLFIVDLSAVKLAAYLKQLTKS
jgi:hypothetical protein